MKIRAPGGALRAAFVVMAAMAALGGCREEEQDRILLFEQGNYLGTPDETLDDDRVSDLRSRARRQQY